MEPLKAHFAGGGTAEAGAGVPAADLLASVGPLEGLGVLTDRAARGGALRGGEGAPEGPDAAAGETAAALELAMEGLYLTRRLSKAALGGEETGGPGGADGPGRADGPGDRSVYRT